MEPESKSFLPRGLGKRSAHWTFTSISQAVEPIRNASSSESSRISSSELAASPIDTFPIRIQQRRIPTGWTLAVLSNVSANIEAPSSRSFRTSSYQDPGTIHWPTAVHDPPTGPADDTFLQAPSTASSGRKLMTEIRGGSYACFPGPLFLSSIILPSSKSYLPQPPQPPLAATGWLLRMGSRACGLAHSPTSISWVAILRAESLTD